jgi:hypothetical protein
MRGTAVEFWSETLRALKLATSVVAVTVGAFIPYYWLQLFERCAAMASKAMAHLDLALRMGPHDPQNVRIYMALAAAHYAAGRFTEAVGYGRQGGATASGFFRRSPNLRGRRMSASGGKAENMCSRRVFRLLTHNGPRPR